jgi:hypothetical protein
MTECQVVQALGTPKTVDITSNERGDRVVVITYVGIERAGVYRFVGGRLARSNAFPAPPSPPRSPSSRPKGRSRPDAALKREYLSLAGMRFAFSRFCAA